MQCSVFTNLYIHTNQTHDECIHCISTLNSGIHFSKDNLNILKEHTLNLVKQQQADRGFSWWREIAIKAHSLRGRERRLFDGQKRKNKRTTMQFFCITQFASHKTTSVHSTQWPDKRHLYQCEHTHSHLAFYHRSQFHLT